MKSILVLDDDQQMSAALQEAIPRMGYKALLTKDGNEALSKINCRDGLLSRCVIGNRFTEG